MNAVIFPGQGAQYIGMGKSFFDTDPEIKDLFYHIDNITDLALSEKCFNGPADELKRTEIQQLAILAISLLTYIACRRHNLRFQYLAGLSLGEYSCLYPAGVLSLDDVVRLVRVRAQAMQDAADKSSSCMCAVIGLSFEELKEKEHEGFHVANINSSSQTAISLARDNLAHVRDVLSAQGARVVPLEVTGGFHSPFMEPARQRLAEMICTLDFADAKVPIVSNVTGKAHTAKEEIRENLINQLTRPVLWAQSVRYMASCGVGVFYEVGPSKVLKGLIRKIDPQLRVINIEKKEDVALLV